MPASSKLMPTSQNVTWNREGTPPALSSIGITVIEMVEVLYVQYYFHFENTAISWLEAPGMTSSYIPYAGGAATLPLALTNLENLPAGNYNATIYIEFSNTEGYVNTLTSVVNLTLSGQINIQTNQNIYNVVFNRANNSLSGETSVGILNNSNGELLKFWQPSLIFEPKNGFVNGFNIEDYVAQSIATNPSIPATGKIIHDCRILNSSDVYKAGFQIHLLILNDNGIGANPDQLYFEVIKNTSEKSGILSIVNPLNLPFSIELPTWLTASPLLGNSSIDINIVTSTADLDPATYYGLVKINFSGGTLEVPATLVLKQFIKLDDSDNNFCLDILPVLFSKINETAVYVRVNLKATYFVMGKETIVLQSFVIPYINNTANFELGKKLHNYFPRFRNQLFDVDNIEFMKKINCDLTIEELDVNYASLMAENVLNLKYFPGSKPKMFPMFSNFGFRKKNKGSEVFLTHSTGNSVLLEKISNAPDSISFGENTIQLYDFPNSFRPIHMQWENQNLVPEWFTFTGDYSINVDFTHVASKNVFTSLMQKFDTTKIKKLNINTGFILQNELAMLEEMIVSRLVFVKIEGKVYECYNVTSKMTLQSTTQNIIERDLEFIIVEK